MISLKELLHGHNLSDLPFQHERNLVELQKWINLIRDAWGKPMVVTSGYRSEQEHRNIYAQKGIKPPMGSAHLIGCAVDIADPDGSLYAWVRAPGGGFTTLTGADLYCENGTKGWCHFQSIPPKSGSRFFNP